MDPKDASAYYNWGNALYDLAQIKSSETLFKESFNKYEKAIELDPKKASAYSNSGSVLLYITSINNNLLDYRDQIESKLLMAHKIENNSSAYMLACLYARLNEKEQSLYWLKEYFESELEEVNREDIHSDLDFNTLKDDLDFIALLDKYAPLVEKR